jgi:hypothetical protein
LITPRIKEKYFASSSGGKDTDAASVYRHQVTSVVECEEWCFRASLV